MKMQSLQPQNLVRKVEVRGAKREELRHTLNKQWLVSNGLGGYASGTISGAVTWRYHGLLIAALPAPLGRTLMLNHLGEFIRTKNGFLRQFGGPGQHESRAKNRCSRAQSFQVRRRVGSGEMKENPLQTKHGGRADPEPIRHPFLRTD